MKWVAVVFGAVVVSTVLFLFFENSELKEKITILEIKLERAERQGEQIKNDISIVKKIKNDNAINDGDIINRLRNKGYLRD